MGGNQRLLGEAEGEGAVEAGAEGEVAFGEEMLCCGAATAALLLAGRLSEETQQRNGRRRARRREMRLFDCNL